MEDTIVSWDGCRLHRRIWGSAAPKALLIVVHGYGEHSGRYASAATYLRQQGISVVATDMRCHGNAEGARGRIRDVNALVRDVAMMLEHLPSELAVLPRFYWGHSMGALLLVLFCAQHEVTAQGLVFTGAALAPGKSANPLKVAAARLLALLAPGVGVEQVDTSAVSRIPEQVRAYEEDPGNFHGKMDAGTAIALLKAMEQARTMFGRIALPSLILHGGADRLTNPEGSEALCAGIGGEDKTLYLYPGAYHELHHDEVREEMLVRVAEWVLDRV